MLNKEDILNAVDYKLEEVEVKEWGGIIFLKSLTGTQREDIEDMYSKGQKTNSYKNIRAKLLVYSICDENGKCLFNLQQSQELNRKNPSVIDKLVVIIQKISGLGEDEKEEAVKN